MSEILAVDARRFLVLERDSLPGAAAAFKRLFLVDIQGASDIGRVASLPAGL